MGAVNLIEWTERIVNQMSIQTMSSRKFAAFLRLAASLIGAAVPSVSAQTYYVFTDLGIPRSEATDINNAGQVVGIADIAGSGWRHAVSWTRSGDAYIASDLGTLGGESSHAFGISSLGQIVGGAKAGGSAGTDANAVVWKPTGAGFIPIDLGVPLGGKYAWAQSVNSSGQIVGGSQIPGPNVDEPYRAVLWTWNGAGYSATDLGTLGGTFSAANGINSSGLIAGYSRLPGEHVNRPVYWVWNGSTYIISALSQGQGEANNINDAGQVVGTLIEYDSDPSVLHPVARGVVWNWTGTTYEPTYLGQLGTDGTWTYAYDINSSGQVVGDSAGHAFSYLNGTMFDLNLYAIGADGWILRQALGINDDGQIVGYAYPSDGSNVAHAYLLTPIPEPAQVAGIIGVGACVFVFTFRRKALKRTGAPDL